MGIGSWGGIGGFGGLRSGINGSSSDQNDYMEEKEPINYKLIIKDLKILGYMLLFLCTPLILIMGVFGFLLLIGYLIN